MAYSSHDGRAVDARDGREMPILAVAFGCGWRKCWMSAHGHGRWGVLEDGQLLENPRHWQGAGGPMGNAVCVRPRQPRRSGRLGSCGAAARTGFGD